MYKQSRKLKFTKGRGDESIDETLFGKGVKNTYKI